MNESPQQPTPGLTGDEDVDIGVRSAREVFMPLFLKELEALTPAERHKAWAGFMATAVAGMASECGPEYVTAVCDGVLSGLAELENKPAGLMGQLLDRHGKLKLQ